MPSPPSLNPADVFQEHAPLLFGIAYRMLGSAQDAEDAVQDAFLRWQERPPGEVDSPRAYLSTTVTRLCIDRYRATKARREEYVGPWLPEPIVNKDPSDDLARSESITMAFLLMLERLGPVERAAFLLREVFDYGYDEIATVIDRTEPASRQIVHRARERIAADRPRFHATRAEADALTRHFLAAARDGDLAGLEATLAEDVTLWEDGGGQVIAARRPVHGAEKVARFITNVLRTAPQGFEARLTTINGSPGVLATVGEEPWAVATFDVDGGLIVVIRMVVNPGKLTHLRRSSAEDAIG